MHLLSAARAPIGGDEAVDLGQSAGDILVLSAADSELACLAAARRRLDAEFPSVRLANLARLAHPLSVDLHVERVVSKARLVVLRLLGGRGYWSYALEQIAETCRARGILLAALPGDDRPDPELDGWSTLGTAARGRLWRYLVEGGTGNAEAFLAYAATLIGRTGEPPEPVALPRAGFYLRGRGPVATLDALDRDPATEERPTAALVFYRALVQAGDLAPIDALVEQLERAGLRAVGLYVTSLKDPAAVAAFEHLSTALPPDVVLNATGFAVSGVDGTGDDPLRAAGCPVLQAVLATTEEAAWELSAQGLPPRDLAMSVALPEVDGRILARAVSFKAAEPLDALTELAPVRHRPRADRIDFTAKLAATWARLRRTAVTERRVAIVLPNYPSRDGRLANGVGLDTPASAVTILHALALAGYRVTDIPPDGNALMAELAAGPTNALQDRAERLVRVRLPLARYEELLAELPANLRAAIHERWGEPAADPHVAAGAFALAVLPLGNVVVGVQPARGYHIDPVRTYHDPDLVPPHHYLAFYFWLRREWDAHAVIHLGKHGNLEWLPGKAVALSAECWPEAVLGPLPQLYPFIVNDPGEGTQAKRRTAAVIVDHLTPPLTRAESYGPLREIEQLVDEYWEAASLDPRRLIPLAREILERSEALGLDRDLGLAPADPAEAKLQALDNHLCELKELQIRDGLHVFGRGPRGDPRTDLLVALARLPRGTGEGGDASLLRTLAHDLELGTWDPLACRLGDAWEGPRPPILTALTADPWRTQGDTVERLELLAHALVGGERRPEPGWARTKPVLTRIAGTLAPAVDVCGNAEITGLLAGLDGRFVPPGPSGAPTRGRPEVLPTGRNFFSLDCRAVPTPAAWQLGWRSAQALVEHYAQTHGDWPRRVALSAWGTANMRTGGDDLAQALALMGCRPVWDTSSRRVTGVEVLPADLLGRPRVDVTLRVSGFFRDAFPAQIELMDDAVRAVAALDEPEDVNPLAAAARAERARLVGRGLPEREAERQATLRIFGAKPGAYGAGLQALIDEKGWESDEDLAHAFTAWSGFAYGRGLAGERAFEALNRRLGKVELVLHNQDNREHDILDSDDYYQFEGGLAAAVRVASGSQPEIFHVDHARPETPVVRTLALEIGRIVRGRAVNPKWIAGVMRHGYKGAFEIAATVDYLFAFAATARVVQNHHFEALFDAYLQDETVRDFLATNNPAALGEIADRFAEAIARGLWQPRRNSAPALLDELGTGGHGAPKPGSPRSGGRAGRAEPQEPAAG